MSDATAYKKDPMEINKQYRFRVENIEDVPIIN